MVGTLERMPAVAGQFYPSDPDRLRQLVTRYLSESGVAPAEGAVRVLVAPHAGFVYSGGAAGHAFARIAGTRPSRVLLVGCSHRYHLPQAAVFARGVFRSPLGAFPVDEAHAEEVAEAVGAPMPEPHLPEHSLEVQLPFLAVATGPVPVVPILFEAQATLDHATAGEALAALADENEVMVVSTDLSHYLREDQARQVDSHTLEVVLSKDWRSLVQGLESGACCMCGGAAVVVAMAYARARSADCWTLLDYRTSADASGDAARVVGYAAMSMETSA